MGRHLGIEFFRILMDFGSQVGQENRAKRVRMMVMIKIMIMVIRSRSSLGARPTARQAQGKRSRGQGAKNAPRQTPKRIAQYEFLDID